MRWERAWRQHQLVDALALIRQETNADTYRAFYLAAIEQRPPKEVVEELKMNVDNVYLIKHRLLKRLRDLINTAQEDDDETIGGRTRAHRGG